MNVPEFLPWSLLLYSAHCPQVPSSTPMTLKARQHLSDVYGSSIDLSPDLLIQSSISCYASLSPPAQHVPNSLSFPKTPPPCRLLISVNNIHIPRPRGQKVNSYGCFLSSPPSHTLRIIPPPKYILDSMSFSVRLLTLPPLHTVAISFSACCINFLT